MYKEYLFVVLMQSKKPLTDEIVNLHVEHLRELDTLGKLVICGPLDKGGGIVILKAGSMEEADNLAKKDPFIKNGFKSYEIRKMEWAKKENNYGLY